MKNKFLLTFITAILLFSFPNLNYGQAPNLGAAGNFVFFTSIGAVLNGTSASHINGGDMGTDDGAISGFENSTLSGQMHDADALTSQAAKDLLTAYFQMKNTVTTVGTHANSFGSNEVLGPGVYSLAGAVSIAGTLTLDGQNNTNSVFIFKSSAGAFTTGDYAKIILINGASACNVAWVIEGAVTFGAYSNMQGTFISYNGAVKMNTGSTLIGRGYTTNGAITVDAVSVSIPAQCSDYIATSWVGNTNADWNLANNWNNQIIPTAATKVTIPAGRLNYPILISVIDTVQTITINSGASLTIKGSTLKIGGEITNQGILDVSEGTIEMNGTSAQTISSNTFLNNNIYNLIISNTVTLTGALNLTGTLSFGNNNDSLFTGDSLTFRSTVNGTARLADITNGGINSGNTVIGKTTIERYISADRAWRLLSVPITATGAPTINTAWQEGVGGNSTANPNPGYGVQITGGLTAHGFDQGVNSNPSIKIYNSITHTFNSIPASTGTNISIASYPAYFLFIRGDRSTQLSQGISGALTPTTLRMKGQIFTGSTMVNVNAGGATFVGNPYPSAIDFHALTKNNVNDKIYVWDPKINGASGVGGYITLIWNSVDAVYDKTSAASAGVSQYIQNGEAFFVETSDGINAGTLGFNEINKFAGGSDFIFRDITATKSKKMRIDLFAINSAGAASLSDGVLTTYNDANLNVVDKNDAKKLYISAENIGIGREEKDLAIERRKTITENDTTFLNLYKLKKQTYKLQITAEGMNKTGLHALVKDKYLGVQKDTSINLDGITNIVFTINNDAASYAVNRFSIVFRQDITVLPVNFLSLKAHRLSKDIVVEWKTENELQVKNYEVEISADGINFTKAFSINAKAKNGGAQTYSWMDKYVADGLHYYRIKSIDLQGKYIYSLIVTELIDKGLNKKNIVVYDNIVKDNQVSLALYNIDKGSYIIKVFSMEGRIVAQCTIEHAGGNSVHNILIKNYFPPGKYELILSDKNFNYHTSLIKK